MRALDEGEFRPGSTRWAGPKRAEEELETKTWFTPPSFLI